MVSGSATRHTEKRVCLPNAIAQRRGEAKHRAPVAARPRDSTGMRYLSILYLDQSFLGTRNVVVVSCGAFLLWCEFDSRILD